MPLPDDCLWIVTDSSVKQCGIPTTLYVLRNDKLVLAGFFNAKFRKHQVNCRVKLKRLALDPQLSILLLISYKQSTHILTDSRPCVQAYSKLQRDEFSASSRSSDHILIHVSRHGVQVTRITGIANLSSDFAKRNPISCSDSSCQICRFIHEDEDAIVCELSVQDVTQGSVRMPFLLHGSRHNRNAQVLDVHTLI